ncbi:MAG: hypothetical protein KIT87_25885 [Anaerolineae bacterium]|nr:hypothetical protein [Anaerolineae bacterium]
MIQNERAYRLALAQLKALEISLAKLAEELGQNGHAQGALQVQRERLQARFHDLRADLAEYELRQRDGDSSIDAAVDEAASEIRMTAEAFIVAADESRVVHLPTHVHPGTLVSVTIIPATAMERQAEARAADFAAVRSAIEEASKHPTSEISDKELKALVQQARKVPTV